MASSWTIQTASSVMLSDPVSRQQVARSPGISEVVPSLQFKGIKLFHRVFFTSHEKVPDCQCANAIFPLKCSTSMATLTLQNFPKKSSAGVKLIRVPRWNSLACVPFQSNT